MIAHAWRIYTQRFKRQVFNLDMSPIEKMLVAALAVCFVVQWVCLAQLKPGGDEEQIRMAKIQAQQDKMALITTKP